MKIILQKISIQLKTLFFILVFASLFYVGLLLGEYRTLKEYCLVENTKCDINYFVQKGSLITIKHPKPIAENK
jgi:hypothetical protein